MCEAGACGKYGKTWACPPGAGTLEECRQRILAFDTLLVFSAKYSLDDPFDYEAMARGAAAFQDLCRELGQRLRALPGGCLLLSNGGCSLCPECTYPDAPCRHPEQAHTSLSANGILVSRLAEQAHIRYNNGPDTVTYFGAAACRSWDLERLRIPQKGPDSPLP